MISNPASFFVTGSKTEEFVYEGGTTLYHFCPGDDGLSEAMNCNVVFFANSVSHAFDVLRRMFEFAIESSMKYIVSMDMDEYDVELQLKYVESRIEMFRSYLKALDDGRVTVSAAPMNQFYKVGWAFNDRI
jgi:hypothetical protein